MFCATAQRSFGPGWFRATFFIDPAIFVNVISRMGLVYDSRFVPGRSDRSRDLLLYLIVEGSIDFFGVEGPTHGPCAILMDEDQFEGYDGKPPRAFRNEGNPYRVIEVRFSRDELRLAGELHSPRTVPLPAEVWAAAEGLYAATSTGPDAEKAVRAFLTTLVDSNVISARLVDGLDAPEGRFARLWRAARPMAEAFDLLASLDTIGVAAGLSLRHTTRAVNDFSGSLRVPFSGWRESTRRFRIKAAVLGLSEPSLSIAEVARLAGYGSAEAMSRAFRDVGLEAPTRIRQSLTTTSSVARCT